MSLFRLKNGVDLSRYALHCGYIQERDIEPGLTLTLWHEGGPCYHVRLHDHNNHNRIFWHVTESITEARKVYKSLTCSINGACK